jgi:hypothetical protein
MFDEEMIMERSFVRGQSRDEIFDKFNQGRGTLIQGNTIGS